MYSNEFKAKMVSTRRVQLEGLVQRYLNQKGKPNQPSQPVKSPPLRASRDDKSKEPKVIDVVSLGKKCLQSATLEPKDFDAEEFKTYLVHVTVVFKHQLTSLDFALVNQY
jgi:hypothetical protein